MGFEERREVKGKTFDPESSSSLPFLDLLVNCAVSSVLEAGRFESKDDAMMEGGSEFHLLET